jgi:hypothetical protein|tara:strand:- start:707 stop:1084 length:378 start_codon:yes stop_codon:yes gene_type:complete
MLLEYNEVTISLPKPPSLNKWYSGKHWSVRKKQKETYCKAIKTQLESIDKFTMDRFKIDVEYNCRYDVDNAITCVKFLADYLRGDGYVGDDNTKYFFSQSTTYNPKLSKDEFKATVKCYGYKICE